MAAYADPQGAASIAVVGNAAVDLTFAVERYPGPNEKCSATAFSRSAGGQGVNMAIVAACLGADSRLISKAGADEDGAFIISELARRGVRADGVVREAGGRTPLVSIVIDRAQGTRACVHDKTGMTPLRVDELALEMAKGVQIVLMDGRFPAVCLAVASLARSQGARIAVTLERMSDQNRNLGASADVLIMPATLVLALHPGADIVTAGRLCRDDLCTPCLVATRGAEGCVVFSPDSVRILNGFPAEVVDSVGAGDAFAAALSLGMAWGWPVDKAAEFGNYVGARACEGTGERWSRLPDRPAKEEALTLISRTS
jgi:ribokinase